MNTSYIEIYQVESGKTEISVKLENETVWLNLNQMVELFQRDKSVISRHISKIFKENELERNSVVAKNATTAKDGKIYQVGYRIKFLNLFCIIVYTRIIFNATRRNKFNAIRRNNFSVICSNDSN